MMCRVCKSFPATIEHFFCVHCAKSRKLTIKAAKKLVERIEKLEKTLDEK